MRHSVRCMEHWAQGTGHGARCIGRRVKGTVHRAQDGCCSFQEAVGRLLLSGEGFWMAAVVACLANPLCHVSPSIPSPQQCTHTLHTPHPRNTTCLTSVYCANFF